MSDESTPDGGPYKETDVRHGPPLPYLGEKMESAIRGLWSILRHVDLVPKDLPLPPNYPATVNVRADFIEGPAHGAMSDALKAYLGLYDVLEWWTPDLADQLVEMDFGELKAFFRRVWNEGQTAGRSWPTSDELGESSR